MKLSEDQIKEIFDFIQSKGVKYYDLQVELVDHFASKIEGRDDVEHIEFQHLLNDAYASFGDSKFKNFKYQKNQSAMKYWRNVVWDEMKSYFKWPRLLLTLTMMCIFYFLFLYLCSISTMTTNIFSIITGLLAFYILFKSYQNSRKYKQLLIADIYWVSSIRYGFLISITCFIQYLPIGSYTMEASLTALTTTILLFLMPFVYFRMPEILDQMVKNQFPSIASNDII